MSDTAYAQPSGLSLSPGERTSQHLMSATHHLLIRPITPRVKFADATCHIPPWFHVRSPDGRTLRATRRCVPVEGDVSPEALRLPCQCCLQTHACSERAWRLHLPHPRCSPLPSVCASHSLSRSPSMATVSRPSPFLLSPHVPFHPSSYHLFPFQMARSYLKRTVRAVPSEPLISKQVAPGCSQGVTPTLQRIYLR